MLNISILIPVYNSSRSISNLCSLLNAELLKLNLSFEIILVDDYSKDNSYEIIKKLRKDNEKIKIIKLKRNAGQQNAILCGLRYCNGEYIITMDDDMQNPPNQIEKLLDKIKEGYDAVYGIASYREYPLYRKLGSDLIDILFDVICHKPKNIRVSSFRIINRETADKIILERSSFVYISAVILKYTKNIGNIDVEHKTRKYGKSNYKPAKLIKLFLNIIINYSGLFNIKPKKPQYEIEEMDI